MSRCKLILRKIALFTLVNLDLGLVILLELRFYIVDMTNQWCLNIDRGMAVSGVIFLDLKKAFDTVDHAISLKKKKTCLIMGCRVKQHFGLSLI